MEDMQNVRLPVVPTLALGKLDRPMNYGSSAVPIVLTIRDFTAGSGARVLQRGGGATGFASWEAGELRHDRAADILPEKIWSFWAPIVEQFCMARQALALSAESQHWRRARIGLSSNGAGIMRYRS